MAALGEASMKVTGATLCDGWQSASSARYMRRSMRFFVPGEPPLTGTRVPIATSTKTITLSRIRIPRSLYAR
jgi:hypothetical protein